MQYFLDNSAWISITLFLLVFCIEQYRHRYAIPRGIHDGGVSRWLRNIGLGAITRLLAPILLLPIAQFAADISLWQRPNSLNGVLGLCMDFLILDLCCYWFHRLCHHIPLLWRVHQVHHLDQHYDATTGFRVHILELIIQNGFTAIAIMLLAIPLEHVALYLAFLGCYAFLQHSNMPINATLERVISHALVTPNFHATHHHAYLPDTNSNYSFIFSIWDRLFGTINNSVRSSDWQIGLEYSPDLHMHQLITLPVIPAVLQRHTRELQT